MNLQQFKWLNDLRLRGALAGAIGGAVGWLLVEITVAPRLDSVFDMGQLLALDAVFGAIGLALGAAEGIIVGSRQRLARGAAIGAGAGLLGGMIGVVLGEMIYQPLQALPIVGRALGWGAFGAVIGLAEGITRRSWRGVRSAALGGAIGGVLGGVMFDLVSGSGMASRAIALIILGACIGLFVVVVEKAMADGWLKVLTGRFEGRDFFLDKPRLTVGSDERCDVALFGDPQVQLQHALLTQVGDSYAIEPIGGAPVLVGGVATRGQQTLQHEDMLTVGATRLIYRLRKGATVVSPVPAVPPPSSPPAMTRTCPHCGGAVRPQSRFCGRCGRPV
jgi:hypothetical protein